MTIKYKAYVQFCREYSDKVSESYEDVFDTKEAANRWLTELMFDYRNDNNLRDYEILDSGIIELPSPIPHPDSRGNFHSYFDDDSDNYHWAEIMYDGVGNRDPDDYDD